LASDAMPPDRTATSSLLDALGVVVPRLPAEDRIVLRWRRLPQRMRALQRMAVTNAQRLGLWSASVSSDLLFCDHCSVGT
jgi:hypothetical protein